MCSFKPFSFILLLAILFLCNKGKAQSPQSSQARYYVEHFGEEEGLPQNSVNCILPDFNDFLWIATESGITRFNGNRFLQVPVKSNVNTSNFTRIKNFYFKGKDTIIAFSAGAYRVAVIVNNKIVLIENMDNSKYGIPFVNLHSTIPAPSYLLDHHPENGSAQSNWHISSGGFFGAPYNKDTFMAVLNNGIGIYDSKGLVSEIKINNVIPARILFLDRQIIYLDGENFLNFYSISGFLRKQLLPIPGKKSARIFNNSFGNNFFCTTDSVLYQVDIDTSEKISIKEVLTNLKNADDINTVYQKDSSTIVVGTLRNGLYVYRKKFFNTTDPLPAGESDGFYRQQLLPDDQTILAGKNYLFRNGRYIGKVKNGFAASVYSSLKDSKGNYWFAYADAIFRTREIGAAADTVLHLGGAPIILFEDRQGRIWVSSSASRFGYFADEKFTELKLRGFDPTLISCMQQDSDGRFLIGTRGGLFILKDINGTELEEIPRFKSLDIRFIWPESPGRIWVCTYGQGFYLLEKEKITAFPEGNGRLAYVHYIFEDRKNNLWIPTNSGLFVTTKESLLSYAKDHDKLPFYYRFSVRNGLRTNEFNGGGQPEYLHLPDGRFSLASMQGLVSFDPNEIDFNFSSSPILVDDIKADSIQLAQYDEFDIASGVKNVSFSLSSSFWGEKENDLLEYQVVEKGKSSGLWLKVDESGKINLFTPSHGNYQLLVRKRKGLKVDDYLYKKINFRVSPKWYQTSLFLLAMALGILFILIGISSWRRRYYRNANRILQGKVNAATVELQQMNNTLEKKVEERTFAIQQAEIKFRTLVEGSLVGVYIVQDQEFIYVNPRFEEILGYDKGELTGTSPYMIIQEDERHIVIENVRLRSLGKVDSVHYEVTGLRKDGATRQLEFFGSRTTYEGKFTVIGTMLDITERKQMEIELREAELKFRDLVEKSFVGVYILQKGQLVYVNPAYMKYLGYTGEELFNLEDANQLVYREDMPIALENSRKRIEDGVADIHSELRFQRKDGEVIWAELNSTTTLYKGTKAVIGTFQDITARKIAEEQLIREKDLSQSIINSLPGVFYVFDQNGQYQLWNRNHETATGYTAEEMSKMHPDNFIEESKLELLHKRMEKVFTEGYAELEANFIRKDGTEVPYFFNGILINYNEKPCIMGVGLDISERKKAEDQLILEKNLSQSIINSLPGVFFIFDQNRIHQLWNRNFETVTGYTSAELKKKLAGTCVEENDLVLFTKAVEKMYETGHAELEVTLINKFKQRIPFYVNGIAITYDGKPCILGIGIDISERKKAEYEREHANYLLNERIKELTTLYRAGLVLQKEERSIVITLQDFVSILPPGWQYPDVTAARISLGELEFSTPNFKPVANSQTAAFTTSDGTVGKIEVVYLEERPPEVEGPFLLEERKLIDMLADMLRINLTRREVINALQKSEANLHTIFDNTDTCYALLDLQLRLMAFNQRAFDFGKNELDKTFLSNANFVNYFPKNRQKEMYENMAEVLAGSHISYEIKYPQPGGKLHWYYVRMFPIKNIEKIVLGLMVVVSDISEKKQMEQEILDQKIQEQKKVIRAILIGEERERNKIGQELHDNVNQILAGTKLYLGMARRAKEGRENIINESMELIDSAIEEIRTLSKEKVTPTKKVNLEELLHSLIYNLTQTTKIEASFVYHGSELAIEDDLKLNIYRIIQEQLNNILKHAEAKNISVIIEASLENIFIMVKDDGKGFEVNARKKGIGLSNMINRVESFNGTIAIESSPGKGCKIDINIPF